MKKAIPIVIMSALLFMVYSICKASIMTRLCTSFSNVLDDEETKAAAAVKNCKKNCAIIQKKLDLIEAAQKKVNDSCAKNLTPDIADVSKGLDKNVQEKLRQKYNQHSKLYDGTADLPEKDFGLNANANQSPVSTGKGGQVTDLKTFEPDVPKLSQVSEFSLAKPSSLLAPTKTAAAASVKAAELKCLNNLKPMDCKCPDGRDFGSLCLENCYPACMSGGGGTGGWDKFVAGVKKYWENVKTVLANPGELVKALWESAKKTANKYWEDAKTIKDWIEEKYHELVNDEIRCGKSWYNKDKQCCVEKKVFNKCGGRCMPPSEFAVFKNNDCDPGFVGYCKTYNIYFRDSKYLDLAGVTVSESFKNKRPVDKRPICYPGLPERTDRPLGHLNGLFGMGDTLGISAKVTITTSCAEQFDQEIMVGGCRIQTNILTYEADPSGARRIFRSDEPTIGPKQ